MKGPVKRRGTSPFHPGRASISEILVKKAPVQRLAGTAEPLDRHTRKRYKLRDRDLEG